ncbi:MAG: peptidoglycan DD-metalloendopeptidase family protein, partial [Oscillospiraceae bacterium]|nr:peptidoglycan DD-metalloendopeptidase family protein [Oscillospiraceae bacterium]
KLLDSLADEIALLNRQAADKNKEIDELAARIADKQEEIADRFEQLRMRVRTIAKGGHLNELQMLFDTGEFTDFLLRGKLVSRIADNDRRIMEEMEEELGNIEEDKARLEVIRRELAAKKDEADNLQKQAEQRKKNLDAMYATAKAVQKKLEDAAKYTQDEINKIKREQAGLDDQIKKLLASVAVTGNYTAGTMAWPVPAVKNISSPYGPRMGTTHRGIDIANGTVPIYGKNIVAAADGVVIYTNTSGYGGGYGSYIIVDHGLDSRERRITTLYAHCSKVSVTVGQKVVKGETVLGLVGSTGNSTGPHLHFEVRIDGEAVDPIKNGYVSKNS